MKSDIIIKLEEHDKRFGSLTRKLEEHDKKFVQHDKQFDFLVKKSKEHDQEFDQIKQKLNSHDKQLETISLKVVDIQEQVVDIKEIIDTKLATKEDVNNIINTIDKFVGMHIKQDQEMIFLGERVSRNEKDIKLIKPLVGLN